VVGPDARLIDLVSAGTTVLLAVLGIRLFVSRLSRSYPWFTAYVCSLCVEAGVLLLMESHQRHVYNRIWTGFRLLNVPLEAKAVLGIFDRWTFSFPGIGAFGRRLLVFLLLAAIAVVIFTLPVGWPPGAWGRALTVAVVANRATNIGFSMFLLLTVGFFAKFGGPVAPNLRIHTWAMAAYVTATSASYFVLTRSVFLGQVLLPAVTMVPLIFWIVALRGSGETQPITIGDENEWAKTEAMNDQMQKLADAITVTPRGVKVKREK
jgi:hypothetical protein